MSKFSDERLQKAVNEAWSALDQRLDKLNRISHDIKELERHLEASSVRERIEHRFGGSASGVGSEAEFVAACEAGGGPAERIDEYITWEMNGERWRVMYLKTRQEGFLDEVVPRLFLFEGEPQVVDHRPLIETPAEVRLRAGDALSDFVAIFGEKATPRFRLQS